MKLLSDYHKKHKLETRTLQFLEARVRYDLGATLTQQYFMYPAEEKYKYDAQYFAAIDTIAGLRFPQDIFPKIMKP